jgi:hypothetical protein
MVAAAAIGFVIDAIRKIVSGRIGSLPPTLWHADRVDLNVVAARDERDDAGNDVGGHRRMECALGHR